MFCACCGEEMKDGSAFCNKCGKNVNNDNSSSNTLSTSKPVSFFYWMGLIFLFWIPILGFVIYVGLAFGSKNGNVKNYARCMLVLGVIGWIFGVIFADVLLSEEFIRALSAALMELIP